MNNNNHITIENNCNYGDTVNQGQNDAPSAIIETTNATPVTTISDNPYYSNADDTIINMETSNSTNTQSSIGNNNNEHQRSAMQRNFLPFLNEARARLGRQTSYPGSILQQTWHGNRYQSELHRTRTTVQMPENANDGATSPPPSGQLRQLRSWRLNLNNVFSFSTSPSTETLRSLINNSGNFRYATPTSRERPPQVEDHIHLLFQQDGLNNGENSAGPSSAGRTNGRALRSFSDLGGASTSSQTITNSRLANASSPELTINSLQNESVVNETGVTNQQANNATGANINQSSGNSTNEEIPFDEDVISNTVITILSHVVRYLPFIFILSLKFLYDHFEGILELIFLHAVMHNMNKSLRKQVGKLSQKSYPILIRDVALITLVVLYRLFITSTPPDPYGLLISPPHVTITVALNDVPPAVLATQTPVPDVNWKKDKNNIIEGLPLGLLLYYIAINDLVLKLITILTKNIVTLMPTKVIRHKQRARLYVIMEYASQLYRAVVPIHEWLKFLYESYTGLEVIIGVLFATCYMCSKAFEFIHRGQSLKKSIMIFIRNMDSQRRPTESELDAVGTVCPICHDNFVSPVVLECNHIFCDACVNTWFKREQTCPMCRAKVSIDPNWDDGATTYFYQLC